MSEDDIELKPDAPASSPDGSSGQPDQGGHSPETPAVDWEAEARKAKEVAENYRRENEKYRAMEKENRYRNLEKAPTPPVPAPEPVEVPPSVPASTSLSSEAITVFFEKDKQEVIDTVVADFNKNCTDEQWSRFKEVYPGITTLLADAVRDGRPVSRSLIENRVKSFIQYAKGSDQQAVERARAEGAIEARKAEMADIPNVGSQKGATSSGVTEEDREYSRQSGGSITPERAMEIRINRERRKRGEL